MSRININLFMGKDPLYWEFAFKRQQIFERRFKNQPAPWTNDPILQKYKFCNVFRATDRISQYMIRNICYGVEEYSDKDRLFQIIAFRIFSNEETWRTTKHFLGRLPVINDLKNETLKRALNFAKEINGKLYTNEFILCANNAYGHAQKHLNHIELLRDMFIKNDLGQKLLETKSLKGVYELLHIFPLMGDFMSYQIAIDLNYSDLINFSENEFTKAGPGALRGIKKVFIDTNGMSPEEIIMWMVACQDEELQKLGLDFKGLFGRKLHAIDCQGLFCETDKYCREAKPTLLSGRSKIKAKYQENIKPMNFFLPPKWHIDFNLIEMAR